MTRTSSQVFADMFVDYVEFYVSDIVTNLDWLVDGYGFAVCAATDDSAETAGARSVALAQNDIRVVLTEPRRDDHRSALYVERHGDGLADIGLLVPDAAAAFHESVRRGARSVDEPVRRGDVVTASIIAFGDVTYTFVQRDGETGDRLPPGLDPVSEGGAARPTGLLTVDHFAVVVESGDLPAAVQWHKDILDFDKTLSERIVVGSQVMNIDVVRSKSRALTLTLIERDPSTTPSHIDEFMKNHGGVGVQHLAFNTENIITAVTDISSRGVEFLNTPESYYRMLRSRMTLDRHPVEELQRLEILVDGDHDGQLYQIFTRSVHPRNTFFMEIIERAGSNSFGGANIKALYEAVEFDKDRDDTHA